MDEKENKGLALLPLQDVVVGLILPLLSHQDWCALRAGDTSHLQIVTEFFAANRLNPNSKCGGMATHAGLAIELGITRKKSLSPQMEAILIWCQCRTREYDNVNICDFTQSWSNGLAFCALIHNFFPNAFDYNALKVDSPRDRLKNYEVAFVTGEKFAGVPDFLTAEDMSAMVEENRIDPKMIFSYVQEVYRMCNEL